MPDRFGPRIRTKYSNSGTTAVSGGPRGTISGQRDSFPGRVRKHRPGPRAFVPMNVRFRIPSFADSAREGRMRRV